jgi:hypothetical protein
MNTKDKWLTTAAIHDPERRAVWSEIFPDARVPIKSILPAVANLPGKPDAQIYILDLAAIDDIQRAQVIDMLARKFKLPAEEVSRDLDSMGVPILADGVSVVSSDPGLFFSMIDDDEALDRRLSELDDDAWDDEEDIGLDDDDEEF